MSILITSKILEPFGELKYNGLSSLNNNFINLNNMDNEYYKDVCSNIVNNKELVHNYSLLKKSVYNATTKNYKIFTNFIFNTFKILCENVKNKISNLINTNKFNPQIFIKIHNDYNGIYYKLKKNIFYYYDKSTEITKNNKSYSYLNLIKNISFYIIVIKKKYKENKTITDYLSEYIKNNFYNIDDIVKIYNLYDFYDRLNYTSNQDIIDNDIKDKLFKKISCCDKFIKKLCVYINNNIISKNEKIINYKNDYKNKNIDIYIINSIKKIFKQIKDTDMFYLYYYQLLSKRIFGNNTNIELEISISREICDFSNDTYRKINMLINDMINNINETKIYRSLPKVIVSEKYQKIISDINTNKINIYNLRKYAWNNIITFDDTNSSKIIPTEIDAYIQIYKKYYNIRYTNRKLIWDFDNSNIKLSSEINNKKYFFNMNINQATILLLFNNNKSLSIDFIEKNTNMKIGQIKNIIDAFIYIKLIKSYFKSEDDNKNNKYSYYLNDNFYSDVDHISLTKILNLKNKTSLTKENQIHIFNTISENINIDTDNLYTLLLKQNLFPITKDEFKNVLLNFKKIGMIEEKNNKLFIIDSESESSEDSD